MAVTKQTARKQPSGKPRAMFSINFGASTSATRKGRRKKATRRKKDTPAQPNRRAGPNYGGIKKPHRYVTCATLYTLDQLIRNEMLGVCE